MRFRLIPTLLLAIIVLSSCDNDDAARVIDPPALTTEEQIIADCYVVRDALEAFAAENDGEYPRYWTEPSDAGNQFVTFLPGGTKLTNRYTGLISTAPMFYEPQWPGEIGVNLFANGWDPMNGCTDPSDCAPTGYRVIGRGRDTELIRIENVVAVDPRAISALDSVLANLDATVAAAEEYARQAGDGYPGSLSGDDLPNGDTMTDLLPNGELLMNPYWGLQMDPIDGAGAGAGSIGYQPWDPNADGWWDGYLVDALGPDGATVIAERTRESPEDYSTRNAALRLRDAVETFAAENAGEYPRDIDTDETLGGRTLLEILSCQWCSYINAYTGASPFQNGFATSRGEVGYVPLEYNGIVVGYVINALGLFNVELERFEVLTN